MKAPQTSPPKKKLRTCQKPVGGSRCCLLWNHRGRCVRLIGKAVANRAPAREPVAPPEPDSMTPAEVAQVIARCPVLLAWLDAVKVHALELLQKGVDVPGLKAVAKQTRFAWNQGLTAARIAKATGLRTDDVQETRLLSPSKVRAKVKGKLKDKVNGLTWRPFAVTIAREGDKRLAIPSTKISFQPVHRNEEDEDE